MSTINIYGDLIGKRSKPRREVMNAPKPEVSPGLRSPRPSATKRARRSGGASGKSASSYSKVFRGPGTINTHAQRQMPKE